MKIKFEFFDMDSLKFIRIRQNCSQPELTDIPDAIKTGIQQLAPGKFIQPGQTVAIAVGSRGIANLAQIVQTIGHELIALGAHPFIVPAMGSHGGGTAAGQAAVLASYGITEAAIAIPVRSSMDVVKIGTTDLGIPVLCDRLASEADRLVIVNRIKPHTHFSGEIESGLLKMMTVGLGKHRGAQIYHRAFQQYSYYQMIRDVGKVILAKMPIAFGVAILENSAHQTAEIAIVPAAEIETQEPQLLTKAKAWCPQLPFPDSDILIIDEIGKDISGAGLDPNVTGQKEILIGKHHRKKVKLPKIFVRDLTPATEGNAIGVGLADFTTTRLVNKINFHKTYTNAIAAQDIRVAKIPIHFESDREVLTAIFSLLGIEEPQRAKMIWIKNTLDLSEIEVSPAYQDAIGYYHDLSPLTEPRNIPFDADGNLPDFC
ncbi:MAG: lactate racemase domain-containing protein [Hormoscilla sp.]